MTGEVVEFKNVYAEFYDNDLPHISRSDFKKVNAENRQELVDAITKKENLKIKERYTEKEIILEEGMQQMVGVNVDDLDLFEKDDTAKQSQKNEDEPVLDANQKIDYRALAEVKVTDNVRRENTRNSRPRRNSAESNKGQKNVNKPGF